jgi:hypothetical protein
LKSETRDKLENFWYYYKTYVLIGIGAVLLVLLGFCSLGSNAPEPDLNIALITDEYLLIDQEQLETAFADNMPVDTNQDGIKVAYLNALIGLDTNPSGRQVVDMEAAVGPSKLMILDESALQAYANENFVMDLRGHVDDSLLPGEGPVFALPIRAGSFLADYIQTDGLYICVKSERPNDGDAVAREYENAFAILKMIV